MRIRPTFPQKLISVSIVMAAAAADLAAQAQPKILPVEESMFESWGLYIGVAAILGLIGVAAAMRRKAAALITSTLNRGKKGGVTMTYRETPKSDQVPRAKAVRVPKVPAVVKEGFAALPVASFARLQRTTVFMQLPESRDPDLLRAIDQTNEESEEDAQVRTQALKLLSTFRTSNSIAAIAQMALYDLSSKLRSDAVQVLADLDHESVFETIVTCCADPTREVRASAARALFKLSFDRSQAWSRVVESGDAARMRHVARSAIEGDLVMRSFDRLVHTDRKVAYEVFALTALLIKANETEPIYKALADHRDENVKLALLHVLQTIKDDSTFDGLSDLLTTYDLTPSIAAKVNEVRSFLQMTHA